MPRGPRRDAPGVLQHLIFRGIERRTLFVDDADRETFLDRLADLLVDCGADCWVWALMDNHVHLIVRSGADPISELMHRLGTSYALRFNRRHDRVGHLFQNRFWSSIIESDEHLLLAIRYVHRNPLAAGTVPTLLALETHRWTSYGAHLGVRPERFEAVDAVLRLFGSSRTAARTRLRDFTRAEGDPHEDEFLENLRSDAPTDRLGPAMGSPRGIGRRRPADDPAEEIARRLLASVSRAYGVPIRDLIGRRRDRKTATARALVAHLATRELGVRGVQVARLLGISEGSASKAARRGGRLDVPAVLVEEIGKLRES